MNGRIKNLNIAQAFSLTSTKRGGKKSRESNVMYNYVFPTAQTMCKMSIKPEFNYYKSFKPCVELENSAKTTYQMLKQIFLCTI